MNPRYRALAWSAAICTYLLIVLGAVVRITGSGLGCGEHWPRCNGRWFPPLDDIGTLIEWTHRLVAALVSLLVAATAAYAWWRRTRGVGTGDGGMPGSAGYVALGLLIVQVLLGAITVKLSLPPWTVILHLGTAMLLLATLLYAAIATTNREAPRRPTAATTVATALAFVTVLFGALTANLGAATACAGFPLCNGQFVPAGNALQHLHWSHRLLAYSLFVYLVVWAWRSRGGSRGPALALTVAALQIVVAAAMVSLTLPKSLQAAHAAVGAAVWAVVVATGFPRTARA